MGQSVDGPTTGLHEAVPQPSSTDQARMPAARPRSESQQTRTIRKSRVALLLSMLLVGLILGWAANTAFTKSATSVHSEGAAVGKQSVVAANNAAIAQAKKQGYASGRTAAMKAFPTVVRHKTVTTTVSIRTVPANATQATAMWSVHTTPLASGYCHVTKVSNDSAYALMYFQACPGKAALPVKSEWFRSNGGVWSSLGQSGGCEIPRQYRRAFGVTYC